MSSLYMILIIIIIERKNKRKKLNKYNNVLCLRAHEVLSSEAATEDLSFRCSFGCMAHFLL